MEKVETKSIEDLLPDPNNANKHTVRGHTLVENSIRRRGMGRGILAAGKNTDKPIIMAGNLTHEKARDAGIEEVVFVHTTGNQLVVNVRDDLDPTSPEAIALGIEDNESGKQSYSPDIDLIAAMSAGDSGVLSALKAEDKVFAGMLEGMGVKEDEPVDAEPQIEIADKLQEKWKVKTGDLFRCGNHLLLCGDSANRDDVSKLMKQDKATLLFTDPPYGVSIGDKNKFLNKFQKSGRVLTSIESDDDTAEDLGNMLLRVFTISKEFLSDDCSIFVCSPQGGSLGMMMMMMMRDAGMEVRHVLNWVKNSPTFSLGRLDYDYKHEPILFTWIKKHKKIMGGQFKNSVWTIDKPRANKEHPTMKPIELYENALLNHTDVGDILYEPFGGSGTGMIASENTKRICRMVEITPRYCSVILERFQVATGIQPELVTE